MFGDLLKPNRYSLSVVVFGGLLLFILWLFVWHQVDYERQKTVDEASLASMNLLKAFEENVRSLISHADADLATIKFAYEKDGLSGPVIETILEQTRKDSARVQAGVLDERGVVVLSSRPEALAVDYSDREWFRQTREKDTDRLRIGRTVKSKITGKDAIPLSRRINHPDGSFAGVAIVSLDIDYFNGVFKNLELGSGSVITLAGMDGITRLRQTGDTRDSDQDIRGGETWKMAQSKPYGSNSYRGVVDDVGRLFTYRVMQDYPMLIVAGVSTDVVLASSEQRKKYYMAGATGVSCIIVALCFLLMERNRKQRVEADRLQRSAEIQSVLKEISEATLMAASLHDLYEVVHRQVCRVLQASNLYISLLDEENGLIVRPYCIDATNTVPAKRPVANGLTEYLMQVGRAVHVTPAVFSQMRSRGELTLYNEAIFECIGAPLINSQGKVFGAITLFVGDETASFHAADLDVLTIVAAQVSLAIERKQAAEALQEREERFRAIIHSMQFGILIIDAHTHTILEANQKALAMIGGDMESVIGSVCHSFICPAEAGKCPVTDLGQTIDASERILLNLQGEKVHILKTVAQATLGGREVLIESFIDITDRKQAQEILSESEERYRAVMEQAPEAVIICDPDTGVIVEANTRFTRQFGYELDRDRPLCVFDLAADTPVNIEAVLAKARQDGFLPVQRRVLRHKKGTHVIVERSATMVKYRNRNLLVQTLRDVSDEVLREQEEHYQATHDELTGLYNRRGFTEAVGKITATGAEGALLLVDIDEFKLINDVHGHVFGDTYLVAFAAYLRDTLGSTAVVARFGGDEFILFFPGPDGQRDATQASAQMEIICLELESGSFFVQLSGGIALLTEPENNLELQVQRAYLALHHAKNSGKWCCKVYEPSLQKAFSRRYAIKEALNGALAGNEFHLVYQPIFDIQASPHRIVGYEALLRWTSRRLGVVPPAEFVPVAEETNLILPIGKWVLQEACLFSVGFKETYGHFVNVSVNISMRQLAMPTFVSMVKETLLDTALPACHLNLEVTESILMTDAVTRVSYLQELREAGIAISLDDFGTGYSSFTYLAQMPITTLKIDKSLVDEISGGGNEKNLLLIESLLHLSALLGYKVVAEGVESPEQLAMLKHKGCGYGQGYLMGRPLTKELTMAKFTE